MEVLVKFFSYYRIIAGMENITLTLPDHARVSDLIADLENHIDDLPSRLEQTAILVNNHQAGMETELHHKDRISFLYLIGGG